MTEVAIALILANAECTRWYTNFATHAQRIYSINGSVEQNRHAEIGFIFRLTNMFNFTGIPASFPSIMTDARNQIANPEVIIGQSAGRRANMSYPRALAISAQIVANISYDLETIDWDFAYGMYQRLQIAVDIGRVVIHVRRVDNDRHPRGTDSHSAHQHMIRLFEHLVEELQGLMQHLLGFLDH
ncbi:hypothetical protein BC830DRAFT_470022 [Chytriomyces sp. MP71]|nr:hypothetical protein BC830DRAFT_470022 [Chytriomyces sp. MP71]